MKLRKTWVATITAAALVLVGGFLSAADAVSLTKHQIKSIAAKVVDKKAPTLNVAHAATADRANDASHATTADRANDASHATTADRAADASHATTADQASTAAQATTAESANSAQNSATLAGQGPSAYQTHSYRFRLPTEIAFTETKIFAFPGLPPGSYTFTFSATAHMTVEGAIVVCQLRSAASSMTAESYTHGHNLGSNTTCIGGGALTVSSSPPIMNITAVGDNVDFRIYQVDANFPSTVTFTRTDDLTTSQATQLPQD